MRLNILQVFYKVPFKSRKTLRPRWDIDKPMNIRWLSQPGLINLSKATSRKTMKARLTSDDLRWQRGDRCTPAAVGTRMRGREYPKERQGRRRMQAREGTGRIKEESRWTATERENGKRRMNEKLWEVTERWMDKGVTETHEDRGWVGRGGEDNINGEFGRVSWTCTHTRPA